MVKYVYECLRTFFCYSKQTNLLTGKQLYLIRPCASVQQSEGSSPSHHLDLQARHLTIIAASFGWHVKP